MARIMRLSRPGIAAIVAAGTLSASNAIQWSRLMGPVPGVVTMVPPALTKVGFPGTTPSTLLFWTGPASDKRSVIFYASAENLGHNKWTKPGMVELGKAQTTSRPSATRLGGLSGGKVLVAWKPAIAKSPVLYSVGTPEKGRRLSWGPERPIPDAFAADGPTIFSAEHSHVVIATWTAAFGSTRLVYDIGVLRTGSGPIAWGKPRTLRGAVAAGTPTVAEVNTRAGRGLIYLLWKGPAGSLQIHFSTTKDPLSAKSVFTAPVAVPKVIVTSQPPVAEAIGKGASYPLLIVFQSAMGSRLTYVTMTSGGEVSGPQAVPSLRSASGPALGNGVLAAANSHGKVPYIRPCSGCRPP